MSASARSAETRFAALGGSLVPAGDPRVVALGDGFLVGRGLFETIRVAGGRLVFFADHYRRLEGSAMALALGKITSENPLRRLCERLLQANAVGEGALKVVVFADAAGVGEYVTTRPLAYADEHYCNGFRLLTVPDAREAGRPAHKSTDYGKQKNARETARASGADEALFVTPDGEVLEGAATNLFVVKHGRLITPRLESGILPGVARARVLAGAKDLGLGATEETVSRALLAQADEVFVTNALLGVMPVRQVDARLYDCNRYSVVPRLTAAYRQWMLTEA
jgi:branched-subunit amino acid aminotransferase/4-amino-4-deoxychorismate lyase